MDPDPEGDKEEEGVVVVNEGIANADDASEKDLRLLFLDEADERVLASSSPVSLGGGVGPESTSAFTNN